MSSSWRNGMAYCALIHAKYPELISFKKLNGQNAEDNTKLAQKAAELLGVKSPEDLHNASKDANARFLQDLKNALDTPRKLSEEELKQWKATQEFLEKHKMRPESSIISLPAFDPSNSNGGGVSILDTLEALSSSSNNSSQNTSKNNSQTPEPVPCKEKEDRKPAKATPPPLPTSPRPTVAQTATPPPTSHTQPPVAAAEVSLPPSSSSTTTSTTNQSHPLATPQPADTPNRRRVQEMIMNAHRSLSIQEEDVEAMKNEPLSKIQEELKLLNVQSEHLASEQNRLQNLLRDSDEPSALESLILVVNEKNSLVRRQMQLNIFEKEAMIKMKQDKIQEELQQIADIAEDRKTETVRNREQELIDELLKLVNEKNELVHHLDSQEQAIVEDEVIKESLRTGKIPLDLKNEECVIQ